MNPNDTTRRIITIIVTTKDLEKDSQYDTSRFSQIMFEGAGAL